jgi:GNAT superfamily N-acetyltransferase
VTAAGSPASGLARDRWLAERLGKPAWKLDSTGGDPAGLQAALEALEEPEIFVYTKLPTDRVERVGLLEDLGFRVVDTAVTLRRDSTVGFPEPSESVRFADEEDETELRELARRAFHKSRFHLDPKVPDEAAASIKAEWVGTFFKGQRGNWLVVDGPVGRPRGFLQLLRRHDCLVVDLVAVDEPARGRGVLGSMLGFAARSCEGVARVEVGTQAANIESLRAYEALGFRVIRTEHVLHRHSP